MLTDHPDARIRAVAGDAIMELDNQQAADIFCQIWARERSPELERIMTYRGFVAQSPLEVRVMSALKVGKVKMLEPFSQDVVAQIRKSTADPDGEIAARAREAIQALNGTQMTSSRANLPDGPPTLPGTPSSIKATGAVE